MTSTYDRFYAQERATVVASAQAVTSMLWTWLQPRSVIDVGCGTGAWLAAFGERGTADLLGLEGEWIREHPLLVPRENVRIADLAQPFADERQFDLAVCLEVAEHLPEVAADSIVRSVAGLAPVVLFSAAIPGQGGPGHVNEQWPEYWAAQFREHGFVALDCVRTRVWNDERVASYYAQNMILYARPSWLEQHPGIPRTIAAPVLPLVHPRLLFQKMHDMHRWLQQVANINAALQAHVPPGAKLLVLDGGALQGLVGIGYAAVDGEAGRSLRTYPGVDELARRALTDVLAEAAYVAITFHVLWWLDSFPAIKEVLRLHAVRSHEGEDVIIYRPKVSLLPTSNARPAAIT